MNLPENILLTITDNTFEPDYNATDPSTYSVREAARGLLVHEDKIAFLHVTKYGFHKLPGGGIEVGESHDDAFTREVLEETGCSCEIIDRGPAVVEYRD